MAIDFQYVQPSSPVEYRFNKSQLEATEGYWRAVKQKLGILTKEVGFIGTAADSTRYVGPELLAPPRNVFVTTPFISQWSYDIKWDHSPDLRSIGYSIYRGYRDRGDFERLNVLILSNNWYRDITTDTYQQFEDLSDNLPLERRLSGDYVIKTRYQIMRGNQIGLPTDDPSDVVLTLNGEEFKPVAVVGQTGEVYLRSSKYYDAKLNIVVDPSIPRIGDDFRVSYWANTNFVNIDYREPMYYKVTTIAYDPETGDLIETDPNLLKPYHLTVETMDWIWTEAIRRNSWILEIGGERVLLYQRKTIGVPCPCLKRTGVYQDYPSQDCKICYGTAIAGGYENPYPIILAIPFAEKKISQTELGRVVEFDSDYWTSPFPRINQYDLFLRQDGVLHSIGGVTRVNHRGNTDLQQHFPASRIPLTHFVYSLMDNSSLNPYRELVYETDTLPPEGDKGESIHVVRDKQPVPVEEIRGLTQRFPTIVY